jgi:hypothetical protein
MKKIKEFFTNRWVELKTSSLYRFFYACAWTILAFVGIFIFDAENLWWLLIPAPGLLYVVFMILKMIVYAWIINPINALIRKIKEMKCKK